jgi:hypothetical protein
MFLMKQAQLYLLLVHFIVKDYYSIIVIDCEISDLSKLSKASGGWRFFSSRSEEGFDFFHFGKAKMALLLVISGKSEPLQLFGLRLLSWFRLLRSLSSFSEAVNLL